MQLVVRNSTEISCVLLDFAVVCFVKASNTTTRLLTLV